MTSVRRVYTSETTKFNPAVSLNWLSGGDLYNSTLAGSMYFDTTTFGSGKLFGLNDDYVTERSMINNGYSHLALNTPFMDLNSLVNGGGFIALYDWEKSKTTTVVTITQSVELSSGTTSVYVIFMGDGNVTQDDINSLSSEVSANLSALSSEFNNDSSLEDSLESFGYTQFGSLGYAAGGVVGGLIDGKDLNIAENLAEAVAAEIKGKAIGMSIEALGVTNPVVAAIATMTVGALLDEVFEVAMGLDNNFGFGGDYVGTDMSGQNHFVGDIGFLDGLTGTAQEMLTFGSYHSVFDEKKQEALAELAKANFQLLQEMYSNGSGSNMGYGSLNSMTQQTQTEKEQRDQDYSFDSENNSSFGGDGDRGDFSGSHYDG
jgi:hypothetical protein